MLNVILIILSLVGPIIAELIRKWLYAAEAVLREPNPSRNPRDNLKDFWDGVLSQVPLYRFRVRTVIWAVRNASLKHAAVIMSAAAQGKTEVALPGADYETFNREISQAL